MESKRQKQVSKLVQKELGEVFQKDFKHFFEGDFVTIADVKMSPDLSISKVYLSFLKGTNKENLIKEINENSKKIRGLFGQRNRNQLRIIPTFNFYIDDTAEYAQKIDALFANLYIPPAEEETEK